MNEYLVVFNGLENFSDLENVSDRIVLRARQAINRAIERARTASSRAIRQEVNFPASYLSDKKRLYVRTKATGRSLSAVLAGRHRSTSLARFAKGATEEGSRRRGGVRVEVKPGRERFMKGAFVMKLRRGTADIDSQSNLGIAIRLRPGERVMNKKYMHKVGGGLYVLYGPSVNQVFNEVRDKVGPETLGFLEAEFNRLLGLTDG